ncbi:CHAT domain-containing protein [Streptomyces sp. NBC_00433]
MTNDGENWIDRRRALAREWDELVELVRSKPGFADFMKRPQLASLLPDAGCVPIVIVNVSRWRCDALIVTEHGIQPVSLPDLDAATVRSRVSDYLNVLDDRGRGPLPKGFREAKAELSARRREKEETVRTTMEWLWDTVACPVMNALGFEPGKADLPRLWWSPTGVLTLLPLHGAGYHDGSGRTVVERAVSSYTPTLQALSRSTLASPSRSGADPELLVVSASERVGSAALPEVEREVKMLRDLLADRCRVISEDTATPGSVLDAMAGKSWVHFSCHSHQDLEDPTSAALVLNGGRLRIGDISARNFTGDLAYLSSCLSATGGTHLPDEAVTLSAALQHAGYRHVIGTLWMVRDDIAADVAKAFYTSLAAVGFDADRAASALYQAVTEVRVRRDLPLVDWLAYTHTGP